MFFQFTSLVHSTEIELTDADITFFSLDRKPVKVERYDVQAIEDECEWIDMSDEDIDAVQELGHKWAKRNGLSLGQVWVSAVEENEL